MDVVANACTGDIMISASSSFEMKKKKKKKDKKKDKSSSSSSKSKKKRKHDDDKSPKKAKKSKKRKKLLLEQEEVESGDIVSSKSQQHHHQSKNTTTKQRHFPFEYQHILAPMVGASELAFRLLCRKYGATLSYTPMMSASQFIQEAATVDAKNGIGNSNICEFQTIPQDRPLVCHFSANDPEHFARAAALVEPYCDAIDLK